jgi:hypothetical protein
VAAQRRDDGPEVMFTSVTFFTSLDAIRGFAGDDFELAVVEETARMAVTCTSIGLRQLPSDQV